jgi:nicotinamide mononucleotide (NMN) deamidase PncC
MNQHELIEQVHASGKQFVVAITGGGSGAISDLLEVPGGSASVLEAIVPYSARALEHWLGGPPDQYCSERTARAIAMAAFERARQLSDADPYTLLGIGATASLVSNRPKRGPHRVHVAWQTADTTATVSYEFDKGVRTRYEEEAAATTIIVDAIADACGVTGRTPPEYDGRQLIYRKEFASRGWSELLLGQRMAVAFSSEELPPVPKVLFPGAFNPIHSAHKQMAEIAAKKLGNPVVFELSITNVDKPPLDFRELADRLKHIGPTLVTRAPRFVDKAKLAPGCTFVVGADTLTRLGDAKYYDGSCTERDAAITAIGDAACRFLVFGRAMNGNFRSLSDVTIPDSLRVLCTEVSEAEFRDDTSSTALRGA